MRRVSAWALPALLALTASLMAQQAPAPDRTVRPELGPPPELRLPPIDKRQLANGLPVWIIESHEVPLAQLDLTVLTGAAGDPADKLGVASLTASMLDEGAGMRSALELADAVEFLGARLTTGSSFDASVVRLNVPVARLAEGLALMADVALRPTFPEADVERLRQERLTALLQARDDPGSIAGIAFSRFVFGPDHRFGTGPGGNEQTIPGLTRDDLVAFHRRAYQPGNATLVVVGDVEADALMEQLERAFGGWRSTAPVVRAAIPEAPLPNGRIHLIDKPGAEQSQIRIGRPAAARSTPDYYALQVLNTVLGGAFSSRLNQNLREEHGYAYGAGSVFDFRKATGPFVAYAAVQTDKTAESLQEFYNEFRAITEPVPAEELERAKNYLALSFPSQFETLTDLTGQLQDQVVYDLPADYFERYVSRIEAVTAADVQRVAREYITPGRFAVIVVGDRARVEAGLRALQLGEVETLTVDEALPR
ncbi:MAG: M16 family metallopeptidase [Vicinamibacterales bacterium]